MPPPSAVRPVIPRAAPLPRGLEPAVPIVAPIPAPAAIPAAPPPVSFVAARRDSGVVPASVPAVPAAPPPVAFPAPVSAPVPAPAPVAIAVAAAPPSARPFPAPRASMTDPTDLLFDGMYELNFAATAWEAAGVCASALAKALGARAVVIHTHDLRRRELRAIGAHGAGDVEIIGLSESSEDDLVASAVICNERTVTMRFDGELPRVAPQRLHAVGAPRTVVAVPGMAWGRCLAIIEVIDADERFSTRVADSASYVAERFAEYLSAHAA
jgi:hypothetical protein